MGWGLCCATVKYLRCVSLEGIFVHSECDISPFGWFSTIIYAHRAVVIEFCSSIKDTCWLETQIDQYINSIAFIYSSNKQDNFFKKKPFIKARKLWRHLRINIIKDVQDIHGEISEPVFKGVKGDLTKWRYITCLWISCSCSNTFRRNYKRISLLPQASLDSRPKKGTNHKKKFDKLNYIKIKIF